MRKIWLIVKREYITRVRTKAFILGTLALPLLSVAILVISILLSGGSSGDGLKIVILDEVGGLGATVRKTLMQSSPTAHPEPEEFRVVERPTTDAEEYFNKQVADDGIDGLLVLPKGLMAGTASARFHAKHMRALALVGPIERAVSDAVIAKRLTAEGKKDHAMENV